MPKKLTPAEIHARVGPTAARWPTTPVHHWEELHKAVDSLRTLVASTDAECQAVENDDDLSPQGLTKRRTELGIKAANAIADNATVRSAERAVAKAVEMFEDGLKSSAPPPPSSLLDVHLAAEIRAHIAAQKSPIDFVMKHLDDPRVGQAVLHAPGFLSKLDEASFNLVKHRLTTALNPEKLAHKSEAEKALGELQEAVRSARRMVMNRTEIVEEPASGILREFREQQGHINGSGKEAAE